MKAHDYKVLLAENNEKGFMHPDIVAKMDSMTPEEIDIFCVYELGVPGANKGNRQIVDVGLATHVFVVRDGYWVQLSYDSINSLDEDSGKKLLNSLNISGTSNGVGIKNLYQDILYSV
jgi:hypothetical protein